MMNNLNPEYCTCPTCGYKWKTGHHGGHSCSERLVTQNQRLKTIITERETTIDELSGANAAVAAIQYALKDSTSMFEFLYTWNEGEFQSLRDEWDDVPDEVFIGADPLFVVEDTT